MTTNRIIQAPPFLGTFNRTDEEDPLKVFRFVIEIEQFARAGFSKASGLTAETAVTSYREGGDNTTEQKSPGLTTFPDITLERGQILAAGKGDRDFLAWYSQVFDISSKKAGSPGAFRRQIDIVQYNKEGKEVLRWRCVEAWPRNFAPIGELDALSSNNSIEKLIIVHEGFRQQRGNRR